MALVARLERGRPIRIADIVDRLNATYLDWLFTDRVVVDALLQLQTNWMADYRNARGSSSTTASTTGHGRDRGLDPRRPVDRPPGRARLVACRERLTAFSRLDRASGEG